MKLYRRVMTAALSLFTILAMLLPTVPQADAVTLRYGYDHLKTDVQKYIYRGILATIREMGTEFAIDRSMNVTPDDIALVSRFIEADYPDLFWYSGNYSYSHFDQTVVAFKPKYHVSVDGTENTEKNDAVLLAQSRLNQTVDEIIKNIPQGLSEYEKAMYLYEVTAQMVVYMDTTNDQNIYGALVEGQAVCTGFAKSYQYLLQRAGIGAWSVTGEATGTDGEMERHCWNVVWLDGKCYYADVTWDETETSLFHAYFLIPLEQMDDDHTMDPHFAEVFSESCNHNDPDFYMRNSGKSTGVAIADDSTTARELAPYFKPVKCLGDELEFSCTIRFDGEDFDSWFKGDFHRELSTALGMNGSSASWSWRKNEYQLTISGDKKQHNVVAVEGITLSAGSLEFDYVGQHFLLTAQVQPYDASYSDYYFQSSDPDVVTVDPSTGYITATGVGTAVISVKTIHDFTAQCKVVVRDNPEHAHTLQYIQAAGTGCMENGVMAHYYCDACGEHFYDSNGLQTVFDTEDITQPPTGHPGWVWEYDENGHWQICAAQNCGVRKDLTEGTHADSDGDGSCDTCSFTRNVHDDPITSEDPGNGNPANPDLPEIADWPIGSIVVVAVLVILLLIPKKKR